MNFIQQISNFFTTQTVNYLPAHEMVPNYILNPQHSILMHSRTKDLYFIAQKRGEFKKNLHFCRILSSDSLQKKKLPIKNESSHNKLEVLDYKSEDSSSEKAQYEDFEVFLKMNMQFQDNDAF